MKKIAICASLLWIFLAPRIQSQSWIRVNQLGYLPGAIKVAVLATGEAGPDAFEIRDALNDRLVGEYRGVQAAGPYGPFAGTYRLDFSSFSKEGGFYIRAGSAKSPPFTIGHDVYRGSADFLLKYMRQQRSGFNPFLRDSCHTRDGYVIYGGLLDSSFIDVSGGWHDAADYLQYVTTSATAVFQMLFAYQQHPEVFGDHFRGDGLPGPNGIPDILDEAKWGLDWLMKMNPQPGVMFNQIADDRDHRGFRLPTQDTVDYGRGKERPVYFCTGKPQGILQYKNRATGIASTAAKFSSAFTLGGAILRDYIPGYAATLTRRGVEAYAFGKENPGVCQTAPCRAPYFYEEENWVDDMELAAAILWRTTEDKSYYRDALDFARREPVNHWMGADSAHHYQWYPFVNLGHSLLAGKGDAQTKKELGSYLRSGLDRVYQRGKSNPFLFGIPFIWCSNNLVSAMLTQSRLYFSLTGDSSYLAMEASLRDWLFGCNPWGTGMIVGLPAGAVTPADPHSAFSHVYGYRIDGGLVDGPVRGSIFGSLKGITLTHQDAFREFQSSVAVYHDDWGDYSTNEPTMDGTAGLAYFLSSLESEGGSKGGPGLCVMDRGGIIRMDTTRKEISLVFTGHEFADGADVILKTLKKHKAKGSFFFTGDFYRDQRFSGVIRRLVSEGHYLGAHSDKHLLYAPWENRDSLLVSHDAFIADLRSNYLEMERFGISKDSARYFLPPYEWYNEAISNWCRNAGLRLLNFTPGTYSNADWTHPGMGGQYLKSDSIYRRILRFESTHSSGLNGFLLLTHFGTDPRRPDKFCLRLDALLTELERRGYSFKRL